MPTKRSLIVQALLSLLLGIAIYLVFREPTGAVKLFTGRKAALVSGLSLPRILNEFVLYHAPDMLWAYAYVSALRWLTGNTKISVGLTLLSIVMFEAAQALNLLNGTGDALDVAFSAASLLLFYYFNIFRRVRHERKE